MITPSRWKEEAGFRSRQSARATTFYTTRTYCPNSTCFDAWDMSMGWPMQIPAHPFWPPLFTLCNSSLTECVCGSFTNTPARKEAILTQSSPVKSKTRHLGPCKFPSKEASLKCILAKEVHKLVNKRILDTSLLEGCPLLLYELKLLPPVSLLASMPPLPLNPCRGYHPRLLIAQCVKTQLLLREMWSISPQSQGLSHLEDWQVLFSLSRNAENSEAWGTGSVCLNLLRSMEPQLFRSTGYMPPRFTRFCFQCLATHTCPLSYFYPARSKDVHMWVISTIH